MNWYTRFLIFVVTPVVVILSICNIVDSFKDNKGGGNVPVAISVQNR